MSQLPTCDQDGCPPTHCTGSLSPAACSAANPVTYRMLHEDAAGMGLCPEFFSFNGIDPDAPVKCNCEWNEGHQPTCDIIAANDLIRRQSSQLNEPPA